MPRSLRYPINPVRTTVPRGVNMAGLEFAGGTLPGVLDTNFTQNSSQAVQYAAGKGFNFIRIPALWNRIQPTLGGALDNTYKGYVRNVLDWCQTHGIKGLIDIHNYGRYNVGGTDKAIAEASGPTQSNFVDLWDRLVVEFKDHAALWGYGLMNEPHDMPVGANSGNLATCTMYAAYNAAITQIRTRDTTHYITACTDHWSGIQTAISTHGASPGVFINDSAGKTYLELHLYPDSNNSGAFTNPWFTGSGRDIRYMGDQLEAIAQWAINNGILVNGKPGILIGEFGAPGNKDASWLTMINDFMAVADQYQIPTTGWSMGNWWPSDYLLSLHPGNNFTDDRPNLRVLAQHLGTIN